MSVFSKKPDRQGNSYGPQRANGPLRANGPGFNGQPIEPNYVGPQSNNTVLEAQVSLYKLNI